jgi:multimeric flavodoxin WrbA
MFLLADGRQGYPGRTHDNGGPAFFILNDLAEYLGSRGTIRGARSRSVKTVILYDSSEAQASALYFAIASSAERAGHQVLGLDVRAEEPSPCIGCFNCWMKTPGVCIYRDDAGTRFVREIWNADWLVFVSRITWGGYSASIKAYADRILPVMHPYFRKVNGEMHHKLRYGRLPVILAAGYGARSLVEEKTFAAYAESHRDQGGFRLDSGTYICKSKADDESAAIECAAWYTEATRS